MVLFSLMMKHLAVNLLFTIIIRESPYFFAISFAKSMSGGVGEMLLVVMCECSTPSILVDLFSKCFSFMYSRVV